MRTLPAVAAALLASATVACSENDTTPPTPVHPEADAGGGTSTGPADAGAPSFGNCTQTDIAFEVGSGVREFMPVKDGDTVYLYRGPQGGYMIYISVRSTMDPSDVDLCYTETFTDTGRQFGKGCWKVVLTNDLGGGMHERVGVWGQVDEKYWTIPGAIRGAFATVTVTATDKNGCTAAGGWKVHVSSDPGM
jgi:hypothetical protein